MSDHPSDDALIAREKNLARYFTETRHVSWVLLVATLAWGIFAYVSMPKAKDPLVPVRIAVATATWPGASAEKLEQLVTRKIEEKMAENSKVEKIESISRAGVAVVYVTLAESVIDRAKELDDIATRLSNIRDFPPGVSPVDFVKDFGDTAALMLTVASPKVSEVELDLRARSVEKAINAARSGESGRATLVLSYPGSMNDVQLRAAATPAVSWFAALGDRDGRVIAGPGFIGIDLIPSHDDATLVEELTQYGTQKLRLSELHPDVWRTTVVRDPHETRARLAEVAADRYTYRELDEYTDAIKRHLQTIPLVSKVTRSGVLSEAVYLDYSQERLAAYGLQQSALESLLAARNISTPGGVLEIQGRNVAIDPSGELKDETELGDILVPSSGGGAPLYLRDLVDVSRDYQSPARYLNYLTARDAHGNFLRTRAVTLAVQMRPGSQIEEFGQQIDAKLGEVQKLLPEDLVLRRTSDQPLQVRENVALFMNSLYEAIALVVLVAFLGFWEWRSALVMALAIPITLAMTFGFMLALGIDLQQISIASLILALGLLVDDPVVAGDAIKRALQEGHPPLIAAWLGPTKLATAILFATITNIVAYLPFLVLKGDVGLFIYSLPVVLTCSLVASRVVSMTFIPLLGYLIVRASPPSARAKRGPGPAVRLYRRAMGFCIDHRYLVVLGSLLLLIGAFGYARKLKVAFFPQDLSYLSYVDIWLPEDAPLAATRDTVQQADAIVREVVAQYGAQTPRDGQPRDLLESITAFVGGGGPRYWFSVSPELQQLNYAQLLIQVRDKHDTRHILPQLQAALSARIAGARIDARELETGKPIGVPVAVRLRGDDQLELRRQAERVKALFRSEPLADRVRDDWGSQSVRVALQIDPDRANLAGVTNLDVAQSSAAAMSGKRVSQLRDGNRQIPIVARLRSSERAQLSDVLNLYVSSQQGALKVPLGQVSRVSYDLETAKIRRRDQFRAITVSCFPVAGVLASEVLKRVQPKLAELAENLPPGYQLTVAGEQEERQKGFGQLALVLTVSIVAIFLALVVQFKSAIKPLVVFAAIPYGVGAALASLRIMGAPFGFMAFLGIISLIGVIVSHVIVLFDFIEERQAEGAPLREALLDAGIVRLRPVMITVGATVLGLVPLAAHGGPLWEPLCYAQIGGLTCATLLTLLLVPVLYTIVVRDLHWIEWRDGGASIAPRPRGMPPLSAAPGSAE
ncbi:MAG: efflux RND transporter permease subunit [Polyangiales bacterium]